jgi:hypothetical protein
LEDHLRRLEGEEGQPSKKKVTPRKKQSNKPSVSFASSRSHEEEEGSVELNADQRNQRDHWETGSDDTAATSEMDDTKKQLEELQIRTIFSLVEPLEIEFDSKTMKKKLLFITNKQATIANSPMPPARSAPADDHHCTRQQHPSPPRQRLYLRAHQQTIPTAPAAVQSSPTQPMPPPQGEAPAPRAPLQLVQQKPSSPLAAESDWMRCPPGHIRHSAL